VSACQQKGLDSYKLVLVGKKDYFYSQLEKRSKNKHISNVIFTGFVSDGQLEWLYQNASLYVFPSLSEGFGLPGLEAMSYGTPVASSNATCLPEVYGDAAVYFDPTSVDDMARVISDTLNDKELLAKLRKAGPEHAKKFSWEKMARETLDVYEKALKR
jgi:glycosyltransferase involved in cell wall biosynthesis